MLGADTAQPESTVDFSILEELRDRQDEYINTPQNEQKTGNRLFTGESIEISGRNLGSVTGVFRKISEHFSDKSPEDLENIRILEKEYFRDYELANDSNVTPLPVGDNNKVIINPGQLYHKIPPESNIDTLGNYARYGVVASEWFGVSESEGEGKYCAFLEEVVSDEVAQNPFMRFHNKKAAREMQLFFDMGNPIMKKIISRDYFNHKVKKAKGEISQGEHKDEVEQVIDELILPNSPGLSVKQLENPNLPFHYWKAIPGGIPPQLINGIRININRNPEIRGKISEVIKLFPNATIFDEEDNVLTL